VGCAEARGVDRLELDLMRPAVPVDILGAWPRECWCDIVVLVGDCAVVGWAANETFSDKLSSSFPSFRRKSESAEDLVRL